MENPFSLKGKIIGQALNNFTIIKSIKIILVYVSQLKKISFIFLGFHTHTHTNYLFQRWRHFTLSFLFFSPRTALSQQSSFSLSGSLLAALSSFSFLCSFLFLYSCTYLVLKPCKSIQETSKDGKFIKALQIPDRYLDRCIYRGLDRQLDSCIYQELRNSNFQI